MTRKRSFGITIALLIVFTTIISLINPIQAEAKESYFSADLFTPERSKKGTQSFKDSEVVDTSNIFINVFMETSFPNDDKSNISDFTEYEFEGDTYYFALPEGFYGAGNVSKLNDANLTVTVQLMLRYDSNKKRLLEPSARMYPGYHYYAPNMTEPDVIKEYRAYFEFLSEIFCKYRCHVDAWVCGNEVNAPDCWNFFGDDFMTGVGGDRWVVSNPNLLMDHYTKFYDIVYNAVKTKNKKARICICVDHCWTESDGGKIIPTKTFLDKFVEKEGNDKDWCIAYHCYPGDLYVTTIWNTPYNQKNENAQFVDGYNLEVLTGYVKNNYGSKHRILLTEQGFSDSMGTNNQAACLVYTYYKAKFDDMIDVMHVMKFEGCGFELKEPAATIWKYLDDGNPEHEQWIFDQIKGTIGISSWTQITPNWKSEAELQNERNAYMEVNKCVFNGVDYSPVFDFDYYVEHNPTVVGYYTLDPVNNPPTFEQMFFYFSRYGMDMGQESSPNFNLAKYKSDHPELVAMYGDDNRSYYTHYCIEIEDAKSGQVEAFVSRFYTVILGRGADSVGLSNWTNALISKEQTGADVARGFILSDEFMNKGYLDDEFLEKMYLAFFDRNPDKAGFQDWSDKMIDGYTREQVVAGFTGAPEFKKLCADYGINPGDLGIPTDHPLGTPSKLEFGSRDNIDEALVEAYVARLYQSALGRNADAGGAAYWKEAIMTGRESNSGTENYYDPASVIANGFLNSQEYLNKNKSDEEFLTDCYASFFGRKPDGPGKAYWLDKLSKGYSRRRVILEGFGTSQEFRNLLKDYGFVITN